MSNLAMPKVDRKLLSKKVEIVKNLKKLIKPENVLFATDEDHINALIDLPKLAGSKKLAEKYGEVITLLDY